MEPLKRQFLELLDKDLEFRYAVAGYLGLSEILKRLDDLSEEQIKLREEQTKIWKEIQGLREEQTRIWQEIAKLREEQTKTWQEIKVLREEQIRFREEQTKIWQEIRGLREEQTKIWNEIQGLREEQIKLREEQTKIWKEIQGLREEQISLREEQTKIWNEIGKIWGELKMLREDMNEGFRLLRRHIDALGARWGLMAEEAFRKGLRGLVERLFEGKVERWSYHDDEGFVFGHPSTVEADLIVRDREHILIEVKSSVSRGDIYELWRIGKLYERVIGVKPRLAVISPYIDETAKKAAVRLEIETYTA